MVQSIKCSLGKHGSLSSGPQHVHKKSGIMAWWNVPLIPIPGKDTEIGRYEGH